MKFEEKNTINIPMKYETFIYFLIQNNVVVYVGQTKNNLGRPLSHRKEKKFNRIEIMPCDINDLDYIENYFIIKYQPKYNTRINDGYKLITARDRIRKYCNNNINIPKVRKIMKLLGINTVKVGNNDYILNEDIMRIIYYIKENGYGTEKNV